jgi:hypothetical protein
MQQKQDAGSINLYAQDLLFVQLLHTANVCWLKSNKLPTFQLVTQSDLSNGEIDLHFGIPKSSPETHGALLQSWMMTVRDVERLYTIKLILSELQKNNQASDIIDRLKREGQALHQKLFEADMPGVFNSFEAAASNVSGSRADLKLEPSAI